MISTFKILKNTFALVISASLILSFLGIAPASAAGVITEFGGVGNYPRGIVTGPDGNLWVAGSFDGEIVKVTTSGTITKYGGFSREVLNNPPSPQGVTVGADGNIWFTKGYGLLNIGRIGTDGTVAEFPSGMAHNTGIVALGEHVWYASYYYAEVGKMAMDGTVTKVAIPGVARYLTVGPDGNIWVAMPTRNSIGRLNVDTNEVTEYLIPTASSIPYDITSGPDGNIWFTMFSAGMIGELDILTGTITEYTIPTSGATPSGIFTGADGNLYFTEPNKDKLGRITTGGVITEFTGASAPWSLTLGPDGNIWYTALGSGGKVGFLTIDNSGVLEVDTAAEGPGKVSSSVKIVPGTSTTIHANPDANSSFVEWNCTDGFTSTDASVAINPVDGNVICTATFEASQEPQNDLELSVSPESKAGLPFTENITLGLSGGSGTGAVTYSIDPSSTATGCSLDSASAPTSVTSTSIGTCVIKVTKAGDADFLEGSDTVTFTFDRGNQSELSLGLTPATKTGSPFNSSVTFNLTGGSGTGVVTYSIDPSSTATGCSLDSASAPTSVTSTSIGTCVIKVTKAGDANYLEASDTATFTFQKLEKGNQAALRLVLSPEAKTGAPFVSSVKFVLTGGSGTGAVTYSIDASSTASGCALNDPTNPTSISATSAGTCVVKTTKASSANYFETSTLSTFTFGKAEQATLELKLSKKSKVGKPFTSEIDFEFTGGSGTGEVSFLVDPSSTATNCYLDMSNVPYLISADMAGTCVIKVHKAGDGEYIDASDSATFTFQSKIFKTSFDVYFDKQSGELNSEAKKLLRSKVLKIISKLSESSVVRVSVRGQVQPTGSTFNDESLSLARAKSVSKAIKKLGLKGIYKIVGIGRSGLNLEKSRRARVTITWTR